MGLIELLRRRAEVAYVRTQHLIQVCAAVDDPDTLAREVRALQAAAGEHPSARLLIVTPETQLPFPKVPAPIEIVPAWQWLLDPEL